MPRLALLDDKSIGFPDPGLARREPNGLLAVGGDLSVPRLVEAYRRGIFPWYEADQPILWWSPDPRCVINPGTFTPGRSLARRLRKQDYRIRIDTDFAAVIEACRLRPPGHSQAGQQGTWITDEMAAAYLRLHEAGYAHSVECYMDGSLAGGLYGVGLGRLFFGESMFHRVTDASKIAFAHLMRLMATLDSPLVDCQLPNPHLESLGAFLLPRDDFVELLQQHLPDKAGDIPMLDWAAIGEVGLS